MIPNQNKPREHFESFAIALRLALISIFSMSLAKPKSKVELAALSIILEYHHGYVYNSLSTASIWTS
jgi:hypothetical protein